MIRGIAGVAAVALAAAGLTATSAAWGSGIGVTSGRLGAATLAAPPLYPTGVTVATNARGGSAPDMRDVITVTFSSPVSAATVCVDPPDVPLDGFTVTLVDGGVANDVLTLTGGPAGCPTPRFGTLDLGTPGYLGSGATQFTNSTVNVVTTPPSITITLGSKPQPKLTDVDGATSVRFIPDPGLEDRFGNPVRGTATDALDF